MFSWRPGNVSPIGVHLTRSRVQLAQFQERGESRSVRALATFDLGASSNSDDERREGEIAERMREELLRNSFSGKQAVCCLSSEEMMIHNLRLPLLGPDEIQGAIELEAQERISVPLEQVELRYLKAGEVRQESQVKQEMILIGVLQDVVSRRIRLLQKAGLETIAIELEPIAVLRFNLLQQQKQRGLGGSRAYVHIGGAGTSVLFSDGNEISFLKTIPVSSQMLDEAVGRHLGIDEEEASRMRGSLQSVSELDPHDEIHRSIIEAIRQPLESLCVETELCLRYHKVSFRSKPIGEMVLSGPETCGWLGEYFQARLGMNCVLANPFQGFDERLRLSRRDWSGGWITAMGLAMRPSHRRASA